LTASTDQVHADEVGLQSAKVNCSHPRRDPVSRLEAKREHFVRVAAVADEHGLDRDARGYRAVGEQIAAELAELRGRPAPTATG
jgi:hypothetical protein